jgi:hypothetical protein
LRGGRAAARGPQAPPRIWVAPCPAAAATLKCHRRVPILLGEVAQHLTSVDVSCNFCQRRGKASIARLMREHGPDSRSRRCCGCCPPTARGAWPGRSPNRAACICRGWWTCSGRRVGRHYRKTDCLTSAPCQDATGLPRPVEAAAASIRRSPEHAPEPSRCRRCPGNAGATRWRPTVRPPVQRWCGSRRHRLR